MATSVSSVISFFPSAQNGFQTTLASTIASGATTVPLNSVAGYSNGEIAVMVVDPTSATLKQTFTGTVDTAGVQLTSVVWTAGTNASHAGGTTVVDYATATHISMMTKGILVGHAQTGAHIADLPLTTPKITTGIKDASGNTIIPMTGSSSTTSIKLTTTAVGPSYVESGCVISGDSYGVTRNYSITAGVVYINGVRNVVAAASAGTATASRDTYVDLLDAGTGTTTLVVTGGNIVTNNAASPTLAANSIRVGIVVAGATTIAAAASINQGQEDRVLPIASSVAYSVTDSLGNLICPRDPSSRTIGYRQITADFTTTATSATQVTGLTVPVIVPTGRKIRITVSSPGFFNSTAANGALLGVWDGAVGGTRLSYGNGILNSSSASPGVASAVVTPTSASKTFNVSAHSVAAGTTTVQAASTGPAYVMVELA